MTSKIVRRSHARRSVVGLLSAVVTLVSFVIILWGLSAAAPLHLFGREIADSRLSGLGRADLLGPRNLA